MGKQVIVRRKGIMNSSFLRSLRSFLTGRNEMKTVAAEFDSNWR